MNIPVNSYIKVIDGVAAGSPFTLPTNYVKDDGATVFNVAMLTELEKIAIGLYPVVEALPEAFDDRYQIATPVFTVNADHVALNYTITDMPLADYKQQRIAEVYMHCAALIDNSARRYSAAEIAQFPGMQAEVIAYNADNNVIGPMMQTVINRGRHTAASLAEKLIPKISLQNTALQARDDHVSAITALTTHQELADYDVTVGWP